MTDEANLPVVLEGSAPAGVGSLTLAKLESEGKEVAPSAGLDKNDPKVQMLEQDIHTRVAWVTQQIQELADKAGVKADVLVKVVLNPK